MKLKQQQRRAVVRHGLAALRAGQHATSPALTRGERQAARRTRADHLAAVAAITGEMSA